MPTLSFNHFILFGFYNLIILHEDANLLILPIMFLQLSAIFFGFLPSIRSVMFWNVILYFSILLHCIVQRVLQVMFPSACSFIVCWFSLSFTTWRWPCRLKHVVKDSENQHTIKLHADGNITCNIHSETSQSFHTFFPVRWKT
jgi:hypothetical protein